MPSVGPETEHFLRRFLQAIREPERMVSGQMGFARRWALSFSGCEIISARFHAQLTAVNCKWEIVNRTEAFFYHDYDSRFTTIMEPYEFHNGNG